MSLTEKQKCRAKFNRFLTHSLIYTQKIVFHLLIVFLLLKMYLTMIISLQK